MLAANCVRPSAAARFRRLARILNSFLFPAGQDIGRARRLFEAGSMFIFRRQRPTKMPDGLRQFALINENTSEVKMRQPVAGTIFGPLAVMFSRLIQTKQTRSAKLAKENLLSVSLPFVPFSLLSSI